jgi:hypothetical protein
MAVSVITGNEVKLREGELYLLFYVGPFELTIHSNGPKIAS